MISDSDSDSDFKKPQPKRPKVTSHTNDTVYDFEHFPPMLPVTPHSDFDFDHFPPVSLLPPRKKSSKRAQPQIIDDDLEILKVLAPMGTHQMKDISFNDQQELIDEEKELIATIQESMKKASNKYGDTVAEIAKKYPWTTANLNAEDVSNWLELCQEYSDDISVDDVNTEIRKSLFFCSTYQHQASDEYKRISATTFERMLDNYNYLCIEVGIPPYSGIKFLPPPTDVANDLHSIVLTIDKLKHNIKIFDSSRFYNGGNFAALLYSLLLPLTYGREDETTGVSIPIPIDEACEAAVLNVTLCKFIVNKLFGLNKPKIIFETHGNIENPQKTFETIVMKALAKDWKFIGYNYSPQYMFQSSDAPKLFDKGYCATYSAWFCWLCTVCPFNVFRFDGVTDPPLRNIKLFAAYVNWCLKFNHKIEVPEKLQYYTEPLIDT